MTKDKLIKLFEKAGFTVNYKFDGGKTLVLDDLGLKGEWPDGNLEEFLELVNKNEIIALMQYGPQQYHVVVKKTDHWCPWGYIQLGNPYQFGFLYE